MRIERPGISVRHGEKHPIREEFCVVPSDGVARWVSEDIFRTIDHMIKQNQAYVEQTNEVMAKGDRWGVVTDITTFVEASRAKIEAMSSYEVTAYFENKKLSK